MIFPIVFAFSAHAAWASSDNYCEPNWTLSQQVYNRCSNIPVLSPGNDTRVNLKLLFVDNGLATLQAKPVRDDYEEFGYGNVPFSLDTFEKYIFVPGKTSDDPDNENTSASYGFVTRCNSNDAGKADFIDALEQCKDIPTAERQLLTEERKKLTPTCADVATTSAPDNSGLSRINKQNISSQAGTQFMQYLTAATAFYEGRYDEAEAGFATMGNSEQPWLKESSRYMSGRTGLNRSQQHAFDEYGFPLLEKVDQSALQVAETHFNNYLKEYPDGQYAASARGLLRRVYWLSNQPQKLADEYEWQLSHPESSQHNVSLHELALEADNKLLVSADPSQIKSPLLLATLDLSLMRTDSPGAMKISFSDLKKQQPIFAGHAPLFELLLAAHQFYVQSDAAGALKTLSDTIPTPKMTYVDFSRLVLRGLALEAAKDHAGARTLWQRLIPVSVQPLQNETIQLALALNFEHSNALERVFEPESPITEPVIRTILLRSVASADLLRTMIKAKTNSSQERSVALYTLLYKDLLQGHYQDYIRDYRLLPDKAAKEEPSPGMYYGETPRLALFAWSGKKSDDSYNCPSTLDIAKILSKNPQDSHGLICLGDFVNANDLASGPSVSRSSASQTSAAKAVMLGSAPSHFPGKLFSRGEGYKTVIADEHAASDLKAYALYRSIKCYATTGFNHCGGNAVEKSVRKSWFQTLKKRYPDSIWAKSLKYYW